MSLSGRKSMNRWRRLNFSTYQERKNEIQVKLWSVACNHVLENEKLWLLQAFPGFLCYSTTWGDLVLLSVFKNLVSRGDNERKMRKFSQRFPRQDKQIGAAKCKSATTFESSLPRARRKFNYLIYGRVFLCLTTTQKPGKTMENIILFLLCL